MATKIIIICGPTAVGKTRVGIELAQKFNGEIISADSQQVWRGFDIGTAKKNLKQEAGGTKHEEREVRHHIIDVANPNEHFDASRFVKLADEVIKEISGRGKIPFVVGGTGMYIRMLVHGLCDAPPSDPELRSELEAQIEAHSVPVLHEKLKQLDPETAALLHPNDKTRIIRALEIYELTGMPASEFRKQHCFEERRYDALKIGLNIDRAELYKRINDRVDQMMANGLLDEVKTLLNQHDESCQPFTAVGYRELVDHIKGRIGLDEAIMLTKRNTRHFAKRQLTWFKADEEIKWFDPVRFDEIANAVSSFVDTGPRSV